MPYGGNDWLALTQEPTLEPELPICDPHHHFAQFIAVCSSSMLAEMRCIFSLWQSVFPAKTYAASRPFRVHGHQ